MHPEVVKRVQQEVWDYCEKHLHARYLQIFKCGNRYYSIENDCSIRTDISYKIAAYKNKGKSIHEAHSNLHIGEDHVFVFPDGSAKIFDSHLAL